MTKKIETERFDYLIREETPDDNAFILSSWKQSYRATYPDLHSGPFFSSLEQQLRKIRKRSKILVACDPERPEFIVGYVVYEPEAVHYIYVKEIRRENGVARELLKACGQNKHPIVCTYWTRACERYAAKKPGALLYSPSKREAA